MTDLVRKYLATNRVYYLAVVLTFHLRRRRQGYNRTDRYIVKKFIIDCLRWSSLKWKV